ncbi:uncharacterized protein LOC110718493 isoform X1 [Chenopodium quinoa]|uniref:uncharacterized protein LOC110718493 isoform X1 n=1 Tax=Chenopodium quinoa TaxID=63459 RepID=UPI000B76D230|nr:uncharacterized protein LOC110718493 isoform X1 [Chenopodium quinoa]
METLTMSSATAILNSSSSPSSPLSIFSPKQPSRPNLLRLPLASKAGRDDESDLQSESSELRIVPVVDNRSLSLSPLSKDTAMGLVLSAATGKGWTTGSGMEGPPESAGDAESSAAKISTFPWSLFTKSPRRRMLIAFTCNICSQRTTRAINPHAYTDGTVFVQCCGCNAYHKLVDNLNLFDGMKCYINSSFKYGGNEANVKFDYQDIDDGGDGFYGI